MGETVQDKMDEAGRADHKVPDGVEALCRELSLAEVMRLIERTARWVDPKTFAYLPVWYPEHARRSPFYKANWTEPQMNTNRQTRVSVRKFEGNSYANRALTRALGLRSDERTNWSCCHVWGVDDPFFQTSNAIVQDRRFFSCVANMILLPTPLKAFSDVMIEVKMMLRVCVRELYGWMCDQDEVEAVAAQVEQWSKWEGYPKSWPRPGYVSEPRGTVPFSPNIRAAADTRLARIRKDLAYAGPHYPRDEVREVLAYWKISI